jgi:thioredoxin reductase/NAD-dependent dihydropyrimidine dehydrogenase PreA subunit
MVDGRERYGGDLVRVSWLILVGLVVVLALAVAVRRRELVSMSASLGEVARAKERGSDKARLQYPQVDLSRCIGCGICVEACPEDGVLEIVHGQALVAHGARCVGHGRCAAECPVGAIALTLGDLSQRRDIPSLSESFEAAGSPGLFLAGEVTGYALVRTAIAQGTAVGDAIAQRIESAGRSESAEYDVVIVGAGPAGFACALQAKLRGLSFVVLEQEEFGGTVAKYPRRKLVMTQPVDLPLHGRLSRTTYTKEELMELWQTIAAEHELPICYGQTFVGTERAADGTFTVRTKTHAFRADNVCLALGRRGTPNKLGVPGEDRPKVAYSLLDAHSYTQRRVLVVGGGDSAIEAALGLAEQPGNEVTLSYRRENLTRIKARNETQLMEALAAGKLRALMPSEVTRIDEDAVELRFGNNGAAQPLRIGNDEVFVFAGGTPPQKLLEDSGVSFDPAQRAATQPPVERGTGLTRALVVALALSLVVLGWTLWFAGYYDLPLAERAASQLHAALRPAGTIGLAFGILGALLVVVNLTYLVRRTPALHFERGSLQSWMTSHVVTGIGALLFAVAHSAMAPRQTVGGHALIGLAVLVVTGAIGRYFYAFVPRAANGRELALDEVRAKLASMASQWDQHNREFGERVRCEVQRLVQAGQWKGSFLGRLRTLLTSQSDLRHSLETLRAQGRAEGVPADQLREILSLARRAHRTALMASHYEDLRGLLASWRYLHRWVALLMVLLVAFHVITALKYAAILGAAR